jgi:hypothetical protein
MPHQRITPLASIGTRTGPTTYQAPRDDRRRWEKCRGRMEQLPSRPPRMTERGPRWVGRCGRGGGRCRMTWDAPGDVASWRRYTLANRRAAIKPSETATRPSVRVRHYPPRDGSQAHASSCVDALCGRAVWTCCVDVRPTDRYPPIADQGLIGDLQTAALVTTDGTIHWYCCPRFDSPSVPAALLDRKRGG